MKWINEYKYSLFGSRATAFVDILDYIVRLHSSHDHRGGKLSKSLIISEKQISLSTRGIFRNSRRRRGGKRAKKKGGGTACPEENSKVLVTRVRRNGCRVAKLVPRITSCKSPFRAGTDRWLTRNFRVPYTHPSPPLPRPGISSDPRFQWFPIHGYLRFTNITRTKALYVTRSLYRYDDFLLNLKAFVGRMTVIRQFFF